MMALISGQNFLRIFELGRKRQRGDFTVIWIHLLVIPDKFVAADPDEKA